MKNVNTVDMKKLLGLLVCVVSTAVGVRAQSDANASGARLEGAWTLNHDLTDQVQDQSPKPNGNDGGGQGPGGYRRGGGGGRRGGFGGGGFGGGRGAGQGGQGGEDMKRTREAMRDLMTPADHLIIVQTDSTVILTAQDGRTTRLAPSGKKIKDDNTGIERQTAWDKGKLVSQISGVGRGKITETYSVDPASHRLTLALSVDNPGRDARTFKRVYDSDATSR